MEQLCAAAGRPEPEDEVAKLLLAVARDAGDSDNLAFADRQVDVPEGRLASRGAGTNAAQLEERFPGARG